MGNAVAEESRAAVRKIVPAVQPSESATRMGNAVAEESRAVVRKIVGAVQPSEGVTIIDLRGKITDSYDMEKKTFGMGMCKARNKNTDAIRMVKAVAKAPVKNAERFNQEIAIMKMMDHPNIIKLYETIEDQGDIYLAMELCIGGGLYERIIEVGRFAEAEASMIMQQIMCATLYMHENQVCHRDLKPEGFFFFGNDPIEKNTLKIVDFGFSCQFKTGQEMTTKVGTPFYVAPQVLAGKYNHLADLWSCGVIMYLMLCGYPPFFGETDEEVLAKVGTGNFSFLAADWKNVSDDAKHLIRLLLKINPKVRFTAEQSLQHTWIKENAPNAKMRRTSPVCC